MTSGRGKRSTKTVPVAEIDRISQQSGYASAWSENPKPDKAVLGGDFALQRFADGLRVHVTSGVEMADLTSTFTAAPALTIFVLLEGYVAFTADGELCELGADDGVNVETGLIWSRTRETRVERHMRRGRQVCKVGLTLEQDWFDRLDLPLPPALERFRARHMAQLQWCPSPRVLANACDIVRPTETSALQSRLAAQRKALQIVQEVFALFDGEDSGDEDRPITQPARRIRDFLDQTLQLDLSLEEIARGLGMSVTVLQERFRDAFDMPIGEYRRQQRLGRAMVALRDHGVSIDDAAVLAGYKSPANFATAFSRHFGYAPSRARR